MYKLNRLMLVVDQNRITIHKLIKLLKKINKWCSGWLLSRETMLLFAASCRLIAGMMPRALDLLVNLVCFDVYSRSASKTGSPGR